ncbi:MAG: NAD-dependent epimerase/dehydratase family protein [Burkholderiales bacterium]
MKKMIITGSSGLVGSEAVAFFDARGWEVHGVDNNMRRTFFGADGDTTWNLERLRRTTRHFQHHELDIRSRHAMFDLVRTHPPDLFVHSAAQPSHDLAKDRPFDDFEVNAGATLGLLEAVRQHCPEAPFIFMSTNKVYGDAPNERPLVERETRWDYADSADAEGIAETCRIDATLHSLFGASKTAADIMVQEYGRYFGMRTVCFRAGCLTGPRHAAAELHGFLAYIARAVREGREYRIYGYKGKQVRDNLHSYDVCTAFEAFYRNPRSAVVYNLGGGRANSVSVVEAIAHFEEILGRRLGVRYVDQNRIGDHICYISDLRRFRADYPQWMVTRSLDAILREVAGERVEPYG